MQVAGGPRRSGKIDTNPQKKAENYWLTAVIAPLDMKIFHPTYNLFFGPPCMYESYIILESLLRDHTENNYPPTSNTNQRVKESLV